MVVDVAWIEEEMQWESRWDRNIYRLKHWTMHMNSTKHDDFKAMDNLKRDIMLQLSHWAEEENR